jgi:hypothetical protein
MLGSDFRIKVDHLHFYNFFFSSFVQVQLQRTRVGLRESFCFLYFVYYRIVNQLHRYLRLSNWFVLAYRHTHQLILRSRSKLYVGQIFFLFKFA